MVYCVAFQACPAEGSVPPPYAILWDCRSWASYGAWQQQAQHNKDDLRHPLRRKTYAIFSLRNFIKVRRLQRHIEKPYSPGRSATCRAHPPGGYVLFISADARCAESFCHLGVGHVRQVNNRALLGDDFDQFSHDRALVAGRFDLPSCVSKICRICCIHMQREPPRRSPKS